MPDSPVLQGEAQGLKLLDLASPLILRGEVHAVGNWDTENVKMRMLVAQSCPTL